MVAHRIAGILVQFAALAAILMLGPLTSCAAAAAPQVPAEAEIEGRHLSLAIGSTQEAAYPLGTDLSISRRGIVDVFHLGDGRWQITALRAGFVVIDAHDGATGAVRLPRLFIDVRHVGDETKTESAAQEEDRRPIPAWICQSAEAVSCKQDAGLVTGEVASSAWFMQARTACLATPHCYFAATLTAAARTDWLAALRLSLGVEFNVTPTAGGGVLAIIEGFCGKGGRAALVQMVEALSTHALSSGLAWFNCREDQGMPRYLLRAQVFLVEASAATELGFDTIASVQAALPSIGQNHARLLANLKALEQQRKAEMIGEPVLRLRPNQPAETASGGEFQVVDHNARRGADEGSFDRTSWKQHGLLLKISAVPLNDARVRLAFDMTFKSRTQGSNQALTLHSMKSEVDLMLGVATMAGSLDLQTSASDQERMPLLSAIPLIGPWFQHSARQNSKSRLFLWLELSEDDGRADILKSLPLGRAPEL